MTGTAAILLVALLCPNALARHHSHATEDAPGHFDYYLLSLSWSPSYCLVHPADRDQCQGQGFGFVLHGLWPQFDAGGYPQQCQSHEGLDRQAQALGGRLYPSPSLMAHEWQRHGRCSGLGAADYFRTADRALALLRIPALFEAPRSDQHLSPQQILAAWRAANPALPPHSLMLACRGGELSEVRLCLSRDLQPRPCGQGVADGCPARPVLIPAAR
ncbi:MAG TPA: ribonuclease T2 [Steroidobacteraceae bacterium]|jgi:ribonuclease T2|nr:ribonuclease T2 [Steroidobacteraceae bacterium]